MDGNCPDVLGLKIHAVDKIKQSDVRNLMSNYNLKAFIAAVESLRQRGFLENCSQPLNITTGHMSFYWAGHWNAYAPINALKRTKWKERISVVRKYLTKLPCIPAAKFGIKPRLDYLFYFIFVYFSVMQWLKGEKGILLPWSIVPNLDVWPVT